MTTDEQISVFCNNVKFLRKKHGLSKKEMAKRLHIGVRMLSKLESGIVSDRLGADILVWIHMEFGILPSQQFLPLEE